MSLAVRRLSVLVLFTLLTSAESASAEATRVGVLLPLSGAFQRYGERIRAGLQKEVPSGMTLVFEDEGCDPRMAVSAFRKLSSVDGVKLFLGPWCGSPQSAVAPLLRRTGAVAILGSSAPQSVFEGSGRRMYSTQAAIEEESEYNATRLNALGVRSVAIVFKENGFSRAHEAAFRKVFRGAVLETLTYTGEDAGTQKELVLAVRKLKPEALYVPDAWPLLNGLLKELKNGGLGEMKVYSVYSAQAPDVLAAAAREGYDDKLLYSYPDLGAEEALDVFPRKSLEIMAQIAGSCGDNESCVFEHLAADAHFGSDGTLRSVPLIWKTVRHGVFVRTNERAAVGDSMTE